MRSRYCNGCESLWYPTKVCTHWRHQINEGTASTHTILSSDILGGPDLPLRLAACIEHNDKTKEIEG